jgi:outer membrane immunogenic protein
VQSGPFVFGLEGDAAGSWIRSSTSTGTGFCSSPGCQIQTSWLATARGRIGYAFDRALPYLTAGGAFGDVQMLVNGVTATSNRAGDRRPGRRIRNSRTLTAKVEYLYANLGDATRGARLRSEHDSKLLRSTSSGSA